MRSRRPFFFFLLSAVLFFSFENISGQVTITVDGTAVGTPLKTVWSWYGYDECNYTNTQPSRDLLDSVVAANLEQVYIRTHFLLNTGDGTPVLKWGSSNVYTENAGNPVYTWNLLDGMIDAIIGGWTPDRRIFRQRPGMLFFEKTRKSGIMRGFNRHGQRRLGEENRFILTLHKNLYCHIRPCRAVLPYFAMPALFSSGSGGLLAAALFSSGSTGILVVAFLSSGSSGNFTF